MKTRKIILASSSPRRKALLKKAGIKYRSIKAHVDEAWLIRRYNQKRFKELVKILSLAKAFSVLGEDVSIEGDEVIAGFDTIVVCKNKILGKPKNKKEALKTLLLLSNKQHMVYTGIGIIDLKKQRIIVDYERTKVFMKKISEKEAKSYIKTKEPFDKAGAYAIQGKGKKFIKKIKGEYNNVVGLPVKKLITLI